MQPISGRVGKPAVFHIHSPMQTAQRKPLGQSGGETADSKGEGPPVFALGVFSKLKRTARRTKPNNMTIMGRYSEDKRML